MSILPTLLITTHQKILYASSTSHEAACKQKDPVELHDRAPWYLAEFQQVHAHSSGSRKDESLKDELKIHSRLNTNITKEYNFEC